MFECDAEDFGERLRNIRAAIIQKNQELRNTDCGEVDVLSSMSKKLSTDGECKKGAEAHGNAHGEEPGNAKSSLPTSLPPLMPTTWQQLTADERSRAIRDYVACEYGKQYGDGSPFLESIHSQLVAQSQACWHRFVWNGAYLSQIVGLGVRTCTYEAGEAVDSDEEEKEGEDELPEKAGVEVYFQEVQSEQDDGGDDEGSTAPDGQPVARKRAETVSDIRSRLKNERSTFFA